jgi:hypothetical protein
MTMIVFSPVIPMMSVSRNCELRELTTFSGKVVLLGRSFLFAGISISSTEVKL